MLLASSAAYTAAVLGCFIAVPQIVLLARTRDAGGLSVRSWEIGSLSATAWLAYGLRVDDPPQILANTCALAGGLVVMWLALEPGGRRRRELRAFGVVAGLVGLAVVTVPLPWLTAPLAATGIASRLPQLRVTAATWWNRRSSSVAVGTWVMTVSVASLWLFYGVAIHDLAIAGSATLSVSTAALILAAETSARPAWLGGSSDRLPASVADVVDVQETAALELRGERPVMELVTGELVTL
ncbi:MAG TPA: hypothetical protein VFL94_12280 [Actinomycetales bacterium]|nr:hypothetical protein [Actinomycetales bacterium]